VDGDGLLSSGEPGVQLTWMDAKVGDWIVTPRRGKAVEIQALWYNALRITQDLAGQFGDPGFQARAGGMADRAQEAFQRLFWNDRAGCLYDVVNGGDCDGAIRPNQIFAVSLHHAILDDPDQAMRVVHVVDCELRTPLGLRSLAPGDPQYQPRCEGNARSRDAAYHQGTVWLWLLGPFISAYVAVHRHSEPARAAAASWLEELSRHLHTAGLGQLSENTDAEAPYTPRGCIAQAWSVAELLRCAMEDVYAESR
jgi:predicted glycogen debranching enzyme